MINLLHYIVFIILKLLVIVHQSCIHQSLRLTQTDSFVVVGSFSEFSPHTQTHVFEGGYFLY